MDTGGLAQMNFNNFPSSRELGIAGSGLASRRGGQNLKPLSLATASASQDNGIPTPRTSRSHLLAGLRTAPKTAAASTFNKSQTAGMQSPTTHTFGHGNGNTIGNSMYSNGQNLYNPPKTAMPQYGQQHQPHQNQLYGHAQMNINSQFTTEQVLAPPEIHIDDQDQMDPQLYAQLVATNLYLAQQQRALQQELLNIQAAAQQFQGLNINSAQQQIQHQQLAMYQHQQRVHSLQQSMLGAMGNQQVQQNQQNVYAYVDPMTGQTQYYMEQNTQPTQSYFDQSQFAHLYGGQQPMSPVSATPRVQVSPPTENTASFRTTTPPKRDESPINVTPLPPPSANAFRRGHKKIASLAMANAGVDSLAQASDAPRSAGPKTASFPLTPSTGSYGPGQGRAGEHPVRQPRGPPSIEELKSKPTTKHEGSKNFAARARRSAVHNLVRAGRERRKGTGSSSGSMSPLSESAEESSTPITDNESDSGRSGSGSLSGDVDCSLPSSQTSTTGTWGAIGSDRPSSREKTRKSLDSISSATSACESDRENSFASVFKSSAQKAGVETIDGQRKAPMLVLTSAEKRKISTLTMS
ncbi:hypothetical protein SODALDRAFT_284098 [Sodiomyces alkalinus F11]|uniref:Uncharacterized protein n=1 Tax=Sodiomyces alkalinus (strain CBS 110278 / VKM F-3762 / F11) TaxID=1314773 RepID=A0A3N2PLT4_SODAK|nr:hypothetical protein SODALDRAFT_284098 [Sodiomyces alkalinus F11]ROT35478.1 hypothetical protein SODALDRAFT_284098 [Sodiomyces alkalinus F11]